MGARPTPRERKEPDNRPAWRGLLPHVLAATDPARRLDVVAEDVSWLLRQAGLYLEMSGRTLAEPTAVTWRETAAVPVA